MFMYSYCYVCSVLCILLHCVVLCIVCVQMCTVLLPPGVNPIAVNKYSGVSKVGGLGCSNPPEIPKALQNCAQLNPIWENC
jgi:hypothetical protein